MTRITSICTGALAGLLIAAQIPAAVAEHAASPSFGSLTDKTLVAWVYLSNLTQRGGGVLTLMEGEDFDALVFGERVSGRWMAGSEFFRRTQDEAGQQTNPQETAGSNTLVQVAVVYAGGRVALYRNGQSYASYSVPKPRPFGDQTKVLLGLRYLGGAGEIGFLEGAIEDVRIYDTALTAEQLAALKPNEASEPPPLAWWSFEGDKIEDAMKTFPASRLEGSARVVHGRLILDGSGYLRAAKDAKRLAGGVDDFDSTPQALFYKARSKRTGNMWDTWLYRHGGTNYLYTLAISRGQGSLDNISLATSPDGVQWQEVGRVLSKAPGVTWMGTGSTWKSPDFEANGRFFMNFSEWKGPRQTIFFAESKDLVHWTRLGPNYEFVQDERWYERNGRWDCIWTLPRPGGGYYGYWTASPKAETGGRFGFGETLDGIIWKALAPPKVVGAGEGEVGAVEKLGDRYYMMFGTGGRMVTLMAERPEGPFELARKNPELLAGHTYFSRFFRMSEGVLVNHHSVARDGQVYFGTLKSTVIDAAGTLRLGWWKGNEGMKRQPVEVRLPAPDSAPATVTMLDGRFDAASGLILEGTFKLPTNTTASPVGLYLDQGEAAGSAILVRFGGITELGPLRADGSGFQAEQRVDRDWSFGPTARFRLLLKGSLCEFYIDDLLIQCFSLPQPAGGGIGFLSGGNKDAFGNLKAWRTEGPQ